MSSTQKGSVLIVVLLVVSAVMICSINALKNISLMRELACKQQHHQQIMWATEGLLRYGVHICAHNKERLIRNLCKQETIVVPEWPNKKSIYNGIITITPVKKDVVTVRAVLQCDAATLCAFRCNVERDKHVVMSEWTLED